MSSNADFKLSLRTPNQPLYSSQISIAKFVKKTPFREAKLSATDQKPKWIHPPCKSTRLNHPTNFPKIDNLRKTKPSKKDQSCQCAFYEPSVTYSKKNALTFDKKLGAIGEGNFTGTISVRNKSIGIQVTNYSTGSENDGELKFSYQSSQPTTYSKGKEISKRNLSDLPMIKSGYFKGDSKEYKNKSKLKVYSDLERYGTPETVSASLVPGNNDTLAVMKPAILPDDSITSMKGSSFAKNPAFEIEFKDKPQSQKSKDNFSIELSSKRNGKPTIYLRAPDISNSLSSAMHKITFQIDPNFDCIIRENIFIPFTQASLNTKPFPPIEDSRKTQERTTLPKKKKRFLKRMNDFITIKKDFRKKRGGEESLHLDPVPYSRVKPLDQDSGHASSGLFSDTTPPPKKAWRLEGNMKALQIIVAQQECINQLKYICEQQAALFDKVGCRTSDGSSKLSRDFKLSKNIPTSTPLGKTTTDPSVDKKNFDLLDKMCEMVENNQIRVNWN